MTTQAVATTSVSKRGIMLGEGFDEGRVFPENVVVLQGVVCDMEIVDEIDAVLEFRLKVYQKPWPKAGQRVGFEIGGTRFLGHVHSTKLTLARAVGTPCWVMEMHGFVEEFSGKDTKGN